MREFPPSVASSTQFMCRTSRTGLQSGLSQHPLGFFQGEFRVVGHNDRQQFGPYLSESKQFRLPAFTIGGIGVHSGRVGSGGARQAINSGLVNANVRRSTCWLRAALRIASTGGTGAASYHIITWRGTC